MYLHLGQEVVVRRQDIVGVFDIENTTISRVTRDFLNKAEKKRQVEYINYDLPKSFTVCSPPKGNPNRGKTAVYVSPIAPRTLYKRSKTNNI
jgi:hypothetical protein